MRIVYNKPHLKKLIISQQCVFEGFEDFEDDNNEDKDETSTVHLKGKQPVGSMVMEVDSVANTKNTNTPTSSGGDRTSGRAMMKGPMAEVTSADAPRVTI